MSSTELLVELFRLAGGAAHLEPRYNIAPTQTAPVIRVSRDGERRMEMFRWGLVPYWAKSLDVGARAINARSESAAEKPLYREAFRRRRCLVPADGFFEWRRTGRTKQPYLIRMRDETPFAMAGLWERWPGNAGHEDMVESFTILTTEPNELVRPLHDRMPVIIAREDFGQWLDRSQCDPDAIRALCRPLPAQEMETHAVSRRVNAPANDDPACIERVEVADEGEQMSLF